MPTSDLSSKAILGILAEMKDDVREELGIEIIGLFGSRARGDHKPDSDVDIAYRIIDMDKLLSVPWSLGRVFTVFSDRFGENISLADWDQLEAHHLANISRDIQYLNG